MPGAVRVSLFILGIHLLTLLPVKIPGFSVVQAISGFLILSFVPGFLLLSYALDKFTLSGVLYAIGFSVAFSMLVGSVANAAYLGLSVNIVPFAQPTMSLLYVGASIILCGFVWTVAEPDESRSLIDQFPEYDVRILLLLTLVPVLAVIGAMLINRYAFNGFTLLSIVFVALVPVFVYHFDKCGTYYPAAIASISLALLLQNTVITTYLGLGDGLAEYGIANAVLRNGYWIPGAAKDAMPRIGVLQPAYSLLMDTSLLWTFKLAHPILFAAVPLVTYVLTSRYFSKDVAFLSATLYIFLPRTYQIISRNTRTGAAIFFTAFLLLAILDTNIPQRLRRLLIIGFFWGVITSHYGIGPLVVFALGVAYLLNVMASVILENKRPSQLWLSRVALFSTLIIVWYAFLTNGTFNFIANSLYSQISGSLFFTQSSTAVRSIELATASTGGAFGMPSGSYEVMFIGHLLLGVFTSIGISLVYFRYFGHGIPFLFDIQRWIDENVFPGLSENVLKDSNYIHLAFGMFLFFPLSFGPQVLSAGRTFALVMVIVAPFPVLVLRSMRLKRIGSKPAIALMIAFFLVTSGFASATVTHDVSPQPTIDGERIVDSGSTLEQFAYYAGSSSRNSIVASNFMLGHLSDRATVQTTRLGKFIPQFYGGDRIANIRFTRMSSTAESSGEYVYFSEPETVTGMNTQRLIGFIFYDYEPLPSYTGSNTVYTTGQDKIHYNS
ncbi:DUF2206 domain-containing protein [Halorubrum ezzemoulense]|uniref:DUF2206 domain-containing protein n=1 Tax=Halorubrum ezzemoulense TaxID=337243 RepID=UPI00232CB164|nr:DUF2206 domain-containing protein [Halorubrum ezzemoulense]MDB2262074.1 DUF2206 domain-containing protein [Halorubrum ezzemoulense]MDB2268921.1 DUF2206 domain-containing protein [Halorubrum ezzemoulense]